MLLFLVSFMAATTSDYAHASRGSCKIIESRFGSIDHCVRKGEAIFCFCSEKNSCLKEAWYALATLDQPPLPCEVNFRDLSKAILRQWRGLTRPTTTTRTTTPTTTTTPGTTTATTTYAKTIMSTHEQTSSPMLETAAITVTAIRTGTETETSSTANTTTAMVAFTSTKRISSSTVGKIESRSLSSTSSGNTFLTPPAITTTTTAPRATEAGTTNSETTASSPVFIPTFHALSLPSTSRGKRPGIYNDNQDDVMKIHVKEAHERLLRRATFQLLIITFLMNCSLLLQLIIINRLRDYLRYTAEMPSKPEKRIHLDALTPRMISDDRTLDLLSIRDNKSISLRDSKSDSIREETVQDTTTSKISTQEKGKVSSQEKSNVSSQDKSERKRTGSKELIQQSSDDKSDDPEDNYVRRLLESLY